jgi:hypothetical protein
MLKRVAMASPKVPPKTVQSRPLPSTAAAKPSGETQDVASALRDLNDLADRAKNTGTLGSWVSGALTRGAYRNAAATRDNLVSSVNKTYNALTQNGTKPLSPAQEKTMRQLIDGARSSIGEVAEVRKTVVNIAQDAGTAMIAAGAAPLTGGASLAALGTGALVGAGASVGLRGAMDGRAYTPKQAVRDAVSGAVEGGAATAAEMVGGAAMVGQAAKGVGRIATKGLGNATGRFVEGGVHGAVRGGFNGAASGAVDASKEQETWAHGAGAGVRRVAAQTVKGAAGGMMMAGIAGGALNTVKAESFAAEPKLEFKAPAAHAAGGASRTTLSNVEHLLTQTRSIADGVARRAAQEKILMSAQLKGAVLSALREHVADFNVNLDAAWGVLGAGGGPSTPEK